MVAIKYVGSKARLSQYILPIIQECINKNEINTYIEPFGGGGAIIADVVCNNRYFFDANEYLIAFWQAIQQGWCPADEKMNKEIYTDIKNNKDKYPKHIVALAGFCASYNAKWFGGYVGQVHTKIGTVRDYYDEAVRNVIKQAPKMRDVVFECDNFLNSHKEFKDCFIYCDPPYEGTTGYGQSFDYKMYWNRIRELSSNNFVLCSEYKAPNDFRCIWSKSTECTLDKNSRHHSVEKLFVYSDGIIDKYTKQSKKLACK